MEKVIITGADGFVGSYTVKHFLNNGKKVLALDMGAIPSFTLLGLDLQALHVWTITFRCRMLSILLRY